jgi:hypothetical protein
LVKLFKEQTMPQFSDDLFLGTAVGYQGLDVYPNSATFTGSIATTTLTVTEMLSGDPITVGMWIDGANVGTVAYITAFGTGSGGVGTYTISASQTSASATITGAGNAFLSNPSPMSVGVGPLGRVYVWDVVAQALAASNIAAVQTTSSTIALTAGSFVTSVLLNNGTTVLQLDCPRAVSIVSGTGTLTNRNVTITGYDYYGQPMSEVIATGTVQSTTVNGKKAFYQIASASISGALGATIAIGTTDILGSPVRILDLGYIVHAGYNNTLADNAGTAVAAVTATATTTTGDVRGTFVPASATDGIKRLVMTIALPAIAVGPNATRTGAFGVTQA